MKFPGKIWLFASVLHLAGAAALFVGSARALFRSATTFPLIFGGIWALLGLALAGAAWRAGVRRSAAIVLVFGSVLALLSPAAQSLTLRRNRERIERVVLTSLQGSPPPELSFDFSFNSEGVISPEALSSSSLTIVNFWGTWCGPCREEMPRLQQLYQEHDQNSLLVIGFTKLPTDLDEDAPPEAALAAIGEFCAEIGVSYPIWIERESEVHDLYQVRSFPSTVLFDRSGHVLDYGVGISGAERIVSAVKAQLESSP